MKSQLPMQGRTHTPSVALSALAAIFAILATSAGAAPPTSQPKPKHRSIHCRADQRVRREVVRLHGRRTTKLVCVRKRVRADASPTPEAPTSPAAPATSAPSPSPSPTPEAGPTSSGAIPHVQLDSGFSQNPLDPMKVTWSYSASATEEITDAAGTLLAVRPAPLPEGTVSLLVDGDPGCVEHVGPGHEESECQVTLDALGPQTVTVTYESGTLSSTTSRVDTVETIAAQDSLSVRYEELPESQEIDGGEFLVGWLYLHGTVEPSAAASLGGNFANGCDAGDQLGGCFALAYAEPGTGHTAPQLDAGGNGKVGVFMRATGGPYEVRLEFGRTDGGAYWVPVSEVEDGSHYLEMAPVAAPGWIVPAAKATLSFHPEFHTA
jgi:hypothetical protein